MSNPPRVHELDASEDFTLCGIGPLDDSRYRNILYPELLGSQEVDCKRCRRVMESPDYFADDDDDDDGGDVPGNEQPEGTVYNPGTGGYFDPVSDMEYDPGQQEWY